MYEDMQDAGLFFALRQNNSIVGAIGEVQREKRGRLLSRNGIL